MATIVILLSKNDFPILGSFFRKKPAEEMRFLKVWAIGLLAVLLVIVLRHSSQRLKEFLILLRLRGKMALTIKQS